MVRSEAALCSSPMGTIGLPLSVLRSMPVDVWTSKSGFLDSKNAGLPQPVGQGVESSLRPHCLLQVLSARPQRQVLTNSVESHSSATHALPAHQTPGHIYVTEPPHSRQPSCKQHVLSP